MRKLLVFGIAWLVLVGSIWADCTPSPMLKVVSRDITPGLPEGGFVGTPRTLYRLGNKYGRVEEEPDTKTGVHGLIVCSEPDIWMVNLLDKTGKHMVDPGPTFNFHAPIAWLEKGPAAIKELEFGCELAFFTSHGAKSKGQRTVDGKTYEQFELKIEKWRLELLYDRESKAPFEVGIYNGRKPFQVLRYDVYEAELEPDMNLFAAPEGIAFVESKGDS